MYIYRIVQYIYIYIHIYIYIYIYICTYILYIYCPTGLSIRKKLYIEFDCDELKVFWKETIVNTEKGLLEALCVEYVKECSILKRSFGKSYFN